MSRTYRRKNANHLKKHYYYTFESLYERIGGWRSTPTPNWMWVEDKKDKAKFHGDHYKHFAGTLTPWGKRHWSKRRRQYDRRKAYNAIKDESWDGTVFFQDRKDNWWYW